MHHRRPAVHRPLRWTGFAVLGCLTLLVAASPVAAKPAPERAMTDKGPIGYDVYRQLDRLPELHDAGVDTRTFSSFDHTGGNDDGFSGSYTCMRQTADGCVIAEAAGAGELQSMLIMGAGGDVTRAGDVHVELDGTTVLDARLADVVAGKLGAPFVYPLVAEADQSSGAFWIRVPMPYRESMRVTTENNPGFHVISYRAFADADGVRTFDPSEKALDVIQLLRDAGTADPKPAQPGARTTSKSLRIEAGESGTLAQVRGPGMISALRVRIPQLEGPKVGELLTDDGRAFGTNGYSEFTMRIDPTNDGVRLTRRLDRLIGNQRGRILVDGQAVAEWRPLRSAGAGQFFDQSVMLPASVTAGKSQIVVRNEFISSELDFNEYAYWVDSRVNDDFVRSDFLDVGPRSLDDQSAHDYSIVNQTWEGIVTFRYANTGDEAAIALSDDVLRNARLRITFDGKRTVDSPLGEFFGSGLGEYPVRSLLYAMDTAKDGWYSSWWPMPYQSRATVELLNGSGQDITALDVEVTSARSGRWAEALGPNGDAAYFRTNSERGPTTPGRDWVFLDAQGQGKFVGVTHTMEGEEDLPGTASRLYLEGDERAYVDGSRSPQLHGTGTEDFYLGAYYFSRGEFTTPANGNPAHEVSAFGCELDCTGAYRLMIGDAVSFSSSLRFGIQHGPVNDHDATYGSTTYWYGNERTALQSSDTLDVGDDPSEATHGYTSPDPGERTVLTSVFEGDFDQDRATEDGRATTSPVKFTLDVDRQNEGVVIRRMSDQKDAYQAARVFVDGADAGVWLQPLGNATQRWLEDSFQLPPELTARRKELTIELIPLDGSPAWHAARYQSLSQVAPFTDRRAPSRVSGLVADGTDENAVNLSWNAATDNVAVARYQVYASRDPDFTPGSKTLLGETTTNTYVHADLGLEETWYYRVRAVDGAGNAGVSSSVASGTSGRILVYEAENLLPPVDASAVADRQGNCCGRVWSGDAQIFFLADGEGDYLTLAFEVPKDGAYDLSTVINKAPDYGIYEVAVDGQTVGEPFDGYSSTLATEEVGHGRVNLTAGRHIITYTTTGKNSVSSGFFAGLDVVQLALAD